MSPDQQYLQDLHTALDVAKCASDVRHFEFMCAFNHQVLCILEEELRGLSSSFVARDAIPLMRSVSTLALQIQQPFFYCGADITNAIGWCAGVAAHDGPAVGLVRSAIRMAHRELLPQTQPWEVRRWAFGKEQAQLELDAKLKRELVALTIREVYAVILVWVKVVLRDGRQRAPEAQVGALQAIDASLGVINQVARWNPVGADARRVLLEALAPCAKSMDTTAVEPGHPHLTGDFGRRVEELTLYVPLRKQSSAGVH